MKRIIALLISIALLSITLVVIMLFGKHTKIDNTGQKIGNQSAKVHIVQYGDMRCPHCKKFHNTIFKKIKKDYIKTGKVSYEYKDVGILGKQSYELGRLANIINKNAPEKYWDFLNISLNKTKVPDRIIDKLKLSKIKKKKVFKDFKEKNNYADDQLKRNIKEAKKNSVSVVPTIVINNNKLENPKDYEEIKKEINSEI